MGHTSATLKSRQRGGTVLGVIIGLVLGLGIALAVAVYVTKVPVPFMHKGQTRTPEQDAAEVKKNRDWDPNAPLYGKNPARGQGADVDAKGEGKDESKPEAKAEAKSDAKPDAKPDAKGDVKSDAKEAPKAEVKPESKPDPKADVKAEAKPEPFQYFLQVGAFRTANEAEAHRAKLALSGFETRVYEREQSGRTVFRVRMGPFDRKEDAEKQRERLEAASIENALVRVQR